MTSRVIERWIEAHLARKRIGANSLIVSVYGDLITVHGGVVWLADLIRLMAPFGLNERVIRTSVYRLVQDDWLESGQIGRTSYYRLSTSAVRRSEPAWQRVFEPGGEGWDGTWQLVMLLTGVAEGAGLLAATLPGELHAVAGIVIALAALARLLLWRRYLDGLRDTAAPVASLRALAAIESRFSVFGSIVPASLALLATAGALAGIAGTAIVLAVAGVLAAAAGWLCKYTLIRRAAFTQGIALAHHPVRGGRRPAPRADPGLSEA